MSPRAYAASVPRTEAPANRRVSARSGTHRRPTCGRRILLVDDDASHREVLGQLLTASTGHPLHVCGDGREALEFLRATTALPCIVVTDLVMPVLDGWELVRVLASRPEWSLIPRLVLSGSLFARSPVALSDSLCLAKPVDAEDLIGVILGMCSSQQLDPAS